MRRQNNKKRKEKKKTSNKTTNEPFSTEGTRLLRLKADYTKWLCDGACDAARLCGQSADPVGASPRRFRVRRRSCRRASALVSAESSPNCPATPRPSADHPDSSTTKRCGRSV